MPVTLDGVGHAFPGGPLLFHRVSLELERGRTYALVGPSGAGKSTLLAIVAGSLAPSEGRIERSERARVGWVYQSPFGSPRRTALDHVVLPYLIRGWTRRGAEAEARTLLDEFDLVEAAGRQLRTLSGGQAQRLVLAQALAAAPDLLLVDEPTAQLDVVSAGTVTTSLRAAADKGAAVLVATHDPRTREHCTDVIDLATHLPEGGGRG